MATYRSDANYRPIKQYNSSSFKNKSYKNSFYTGQMRPGMHHRQSVVPKAMALASNPTVQSAAFTGALFAASYTAGLAAKKAGRRHRGVAIIKNYNPQTGKRNKGGDFSMRSSDTSRAGKKLTRQAGRAVNKRHAAQAKATRRSNRRTHWNRDSHGRFK